MYTGKAITRAEYTNMYKIYSYGCLHASHNLVVEYGLSIEVSAVYNMHAADIDIYCQ